MTTGASDGDGGIRRAPRAQFAGGRHRGRRAGAQPAGHPRALGSRPGPIPGRGVRGSAVRRRHRASARLLHSMPTPTPLVTIRRRTPLLTHHSEPLRDLARRFMDVSQNQYAETFIKTLGAQAGTPTFDGGVKAVESVLTSWDIPLDGAVLRDGSGLSRYNYVAPKTLVRVLAHLYRDPAHRDPFFSLLTVAGRTGTIAGRMKNTPAAGNARAKDGAMASVRALCGVVNTAGRRAAGLRDPRQRLCRPGTQPSPPPSTPSSCNWPASGDKDRDVGIRDWGVGIGEKRQSSPGISDPQPLTPSPRARRAT